MSNFTKSILYSITVLAVGLVAIYTIYNNVASSPDASMASIEPAAGEAPAVSFNEEEPAAGTEGTPVQEAIDAAAAAAEDGAAVTDPNAGTEAAPAVDAAATPEAAAPAEEAAAPAAETPAAEEAAPAVEPSADAMPAAEEAAPEAAPAAEEGTTEEPTE